MNVDVYIALKGEQYCTRVRHGLPASELEEQLQNAIVRKRINDSCDTKVDTPVVYCSIPSRTTYTLTQMPETEKSLLYGYYLFDENNRTPNVDADILSADIAAFTENYFMVNSLEFAVSLNGTYIFYPVFRVRLGTAIKIYDAEDANITGTFTKMSDENYDYYVQMQIVPPSFDILFKVEPA
jgi:hypothetical protein